MKNRMATVRPVQMRARRIEPNSHHHPSPTNELPCNNLLGFSEYCRNSTGVGFSGAWLLLCDNSGRETESVELRWSGGCGRNWCGYSCVFSVTFLEIHCASGRCKTELPFVCPSIGDTFSKERRSYILPAPFHDKTRIEEKMSISTSKSTEAPIHLIRRREAEP